MCKHAPFVPLYWYFFVLLPLSTSSKSGGKHWSNHHVCAYLFSIRSVRVKCQKDSRRSQGIGSWLDRVKEMATMDLPDGSQRRSRAVTSHTSSHSRDQTFFLLSVLARPLLCPQRLCWREAHFRGIGDIWLATPIYEPHSETGAPTSCSSCFYPGTRECGMLEWVQGSLWSFTAFKLSMATGKTNARTGCGE